MYENDAIVIQPLYRVTQFVWYALDLVEVILVVRFALRLLDANPAAGFTHFVYAVSAPLAGPFLNVFNTTQTLGVAIEWSTLLSMFVYWIAALVVVRLLLIGKPVSTYEARRRLNEQS